MTMSSVKNTHRILVVGVFMRMPISLTCGAVTAFLAFAAPPAHADPASTSLYLTVSGSENTWIKAVLLNCPDETGSHPNSKAACAALAAAHGDFDALHGEQRTCAGENDSVTATANGTWQGRPVNWSKIFPSGCLLDVATGPVFRF
jgi:hypothetical protein